MRYTGIIYKRTCLATMKSYIGQTIDEEERQKTWHNVNSYYTSPNSKIAKARVKYGINNWTYEILFTIVSNKKKVLRVLNKKEIYFINLFDSYKNGYNSTKGGNNFGKCNNIPITKPVILFNLEGVCLGEFKSSRDLCKFLNIPFTSSIHSSANNYTLVFNNDYLVYYQDNFSKEKLEEDLNSLVNYTRYRKIAQVDRFTGEIVKVFNTRDSFSPFNKELVIGVARGFRGVKLHGNFRWIFLDEYIKYPKEHWILEENYIKYPTVAVVCLDLLLNFIKRYDSITLAAKDQHQLNNIITSIVVSCGHNKNIITNDSIKLSSNLIWMYEEDYNLQKDLLNFHVFDNKASFYHVIQYNLDKTIKKVWISPREVEVNLGFNRSFLSKSCKNGNRCHNYIWKYYKDLTPDEKEKVNEFLKTQNNNGE